jgi:hypothetical protein
MAYTIYKLFNKKGIEMSEPTDHGAWAFPLAVALAIMAMAGCSAISLSGKHNVDIEREKTKQAEAYKKGAEARGL